MQTVMVNGSKSSHQPVISGVPQGSVLGPILFIIDLNDIDRVIKESKILSFADDTKAIKEISSEHDTKRLQEDLDQLTTWSLNNNMELNEDKYELLNYKLRTPNSVLLRELPFTAQLFSYSTMNGCSIEPCEVVRDLGVNLSSDMSWTPHINIMVANARTMASWALGVFRDRSKTTMLTLYKSMIRCKLEYCCPLWDPKSVQDIQSIEDVQRHFTRRIMGCEDMDYWQRLKHLNLQSLQRRRERYCLIHMWKTYQKLVPNDLNVEFYDNKRLGLKIKVSTYSHSAATSAATAYESAFAIRGAKLWNCLPQDVNSQNTLLSF